MGATSGAQNQGEAVGKGGGDQVESEEEDGEEDRGEESDWTSYGNNSGAIGASFTGDDESLMEGTGGKP